MSRTATATPDLDEELAEQVQDRPALFPMHIIVVYNDDEHTFEYVIELFAKVFRYSVDKCKRLAFSIHTEGRAVVWNGTKEHGEFKIEQLRAGGPDFWAVKRVEKPIICELQPVD